MNDLKSLSKNLLFIDIETVSGAEHLSQLSERMQKLWLRKAGFLQRDEGISDEDLYFKRAAIYAEFGKVIVIGMGVLFWDEDQQLSLRVKTIEGHDETEVLEKFKHVIEQKYRNSVVLCAHNGKEFDYPFLCRRMLVNGIEIPKALQLSNKKPWEVQHLDTLEMWKFGDRKHYSSLELLAELFGITSKTELSGDAVNHTYFQEQDLPKIARYCMEDVVVLAQLFLRYNYQSVIPDDRIERVF
jgi:3'-5' exonuclease